MSRLIGELHDASLLPPRTAPPGWRAHQPKDLAKGPSIPAPVHHPHFPFSAIRDPRSRHQPGFITKGMSFEHDRVSEGDPIVGLYSCATRTPPCSLLCSQRIALYPHYIWSGKTVAEGRRIPKELGKQALPDPSCQHVHHCLPYLCHWLQHVSILMSS